MIPENGTDTNAKAPRGTGDLWRGGLVRLVAVGGGIGGILFLAAGTTDWLRGRIFLGLLLVSLLGNLVILLILRPELMRNRWERKEGTKTFDKVFGLAYSLSLLLLFYLAGREAGRVGASSMTEASLYLGLALHVVGMVPMLWAMLENPHLETTVRIQRERGHRVIATGPYRIIRHPMYLGVALMVLGWALILGSWGAFRVSCFIVVLFLGRTYLEDQTLRRELDGYEEFCHQTRYRLIPGLW